MNIHVLQCGSIRVDQTVPFGKRLDLIESAKQISAADRHRITLPVFTYLIEHQKGLILVDTGWCREISPEGVYDPRAVSSVLPSHLAAFFRPVLPTGMAVHEQLAAMGIRPEDLDYVLLTHLDPDHVSGLRHVNKAKNIILPEYEYFWSCLTVYKPDSHRICGCNIPWNAGFTGALRSVPTTGSLICSEMRACKWSMYRDIRKVRRQSWSGAAAVLSF